MYNITHNSCIPAILASNPQHSQVPPPTNAPLTKEQVAQFVQILQQVNSEIGITHSNIALINLPVTRCYGISIFHIPLSLQQLINKINSFSVNLLFGAEVLTRLGLKDLANNILDEWYKKSFLSFSTDNVTSASQFQNAINSIQMLAEQIRNRHIRLKDLWMPKMSDSLYSKMMDKLSLCEKIVFTLASNRQMDGAEVKDFIRRSARLSVEQLLVLNFFGHNVADYSLRYDKPKKITDETITNLLTFMPNLGILDVTNCSSLTEHCFQKRHNSLHTLILNRTNIHPLSIDRTLFPKLKNIINTSLTNSVDLQRFFPVINNTYVPSFKHDALTKMAFGLCEVFQSTEEIKCSHVFIDNLINWMKNPSEESFMLGKALFAAKNKIIPKPTYLTDRSFMLSLITAWKNCHYSQDKMALRSKIMAYVINTFLFNDTLSDKVKKKNFELLCGKLKDFNDVTCLIEAIKNRQPSPSLSLSN